MKTIVKILAFVLLLALCGCKSHKHVVQTEDILQKSDYVVQQKKVSTIEEYISSHTSITDSVYEEFTRVIKVYDTTNKDNPVQMEIVESYKKNNVSKEEILFADTLSFADSTIQHTEVHRTDSISTYVEEEKRTESKSVPWLGFFAIIMGTLVFAYICKKVLKI